MKKSRSQVFSKEKLICANCVMDTSDPNIKFDEHGVCERCNEFKTQILPKWNYGKGHEEELHQIVDRIKNDGKWKKHDSILGLSGGFDSSYMLHYAVKVLGLRPFVFHIDAGWNLPIAEENIQKMCNQLKVDLHIEKVDWEEMKKMQIAFFQSGLPCLDIPQDCAFIAILDKYAKRLGIKYILNGGNTSTEVVVNPKAWNENGGVASDGKFIKDILKKHGDIKLKHYTFTNVLRRKFWNPYILGIKTVRLLDYTSYIRDEAEAFLVKEYGYIPYGQKHFENILTKFLEGYWLPERFGYDIRKAQLSSLVLTNQISREEALRKLINPPLREDEANELFSIVAQRLEIPTQELHAYLTLPKNTTQYKNNNWVYKWGEKFMLAIGKDKLVRK